MTDVQLPLCLRWHRGATSWRAAGERIDPSRHGVEVIPERLARPFVEAHHYSGSYPAARLAVGLYRSPRRGIMPSTLAGVAVFSNPMQQAVVPARLGLPPEEGVELGRLVLLDEVEGNGESWTVARAFALLRIELGEVRGVVSYSDPLERRAEDGRVITPGHVGIVYRALNGRYVGRGSPRVLILDRWGRVVSERALSKIRQEERGRDYAAAQLLAAGAPARRVGEDAAAWVARALREGPFRRVRHPGNLCYVWPLGRSRAETRDLTAALPPGLPWPELDGPPQATPRRARGSTAPGEAVEARLLGLPGDAPL